MQQRFVSDVSHELRTPLTTIRMAADVLHESRADFDPAVARSAELLHGELDRFEALLADLLEISRFDAGAAALDVEPIDLRATSAGSSRRRAPLAERQGERRSTCWRPTSRCIAEVDAAAGRAHPAQPGRQRHRARRGPAGRGARGRGDEDAVAVTVRDHGVGLRPGEAAMVFNRFWRADPSRAGTTGGTGLGLAISLEDARLHDGWLQAWGEPGEGSHFRLTLPRRAGETLHGSPLPLSPTEEQ